MVPAAYQLGRLTLELREIMAEEKSLHDTERDRIAGNWAKLPPFTCAGCRSEKAFPTADRIRTEARYHGRLRADVAALAPTGRVSGVVEVIYSHPPTEQALEAQEGLEFAYYRLLRLPWRKEPDAWLCCPECWVWYTKLAGRETSSPWEARRCDGCGGYFHQNPLSWFEFRDCDGDPHDACCIHCAAAYGRAQWRSPGQLAGGDPRESTPDDDSDPAGCSWPTATPRSGRWFGRSGQRNSTQAGTAANTVGWRMRPWSQPVVGGHGGVPAVAPRMTRNRRRPTVAAGTRQLKMPLPGGLWW